MNPVKSFCRFCVALCGIEVHVDGDSVTGVRGDPDDPVSRGYTCAKGRALGEWHHRPDRLDRPLLRDGDGTLGNAGWDDVIGDLAARLSEIVTDSGPDAVAFYYATGSAFDANARRVAERFQRALGSRSKYTSGTLDTPCKPMVAQMMAGHPGLNPTPDWDQTTMTVLIGTNPVVSHGHVAPFPDPVVRLRDLADGGELWVIDPRETETARLATTHLQPRPGSDYALLAHAVSRLLDGREAEVGVRAAGVPELAAAVAPFDLDRCAAVTGLDPAEIDAFVAAIETHGRFAGLTGTGATMAPAANLTEWLLWALLIVTDSYDEPGGMWFNPGFLRRLEQRSFSPMGLDPEPGPPSRPELPRWIGEYACAALADEIEAGNVRALIVVGGNPMRAFPEPDRIRRALGALDVLAVADVITTETTELATHVLAVAGQLERADMPHFIDNFYPLIATRYTDAVVPVAADRMAAWRALALTAAAMGFDVLPDGLDPAAATDEDLLRTLASRGRAPLEEIRAAGDRIVADPAQLFGWVREQVLPGEGWRIAPAPLVEQLARFELPEYPVMIPRRQVRHLNSQMVAMEVRPDEPRIIVNAHDAAVAGITDGERVKVANEHGTIEGEAAVSVAISQGAVSVPHGYAAPHPGVLASTVSRVDPLSGMVTLSGVPVTIESAEPQ